MGKFKKLLDELYSDEQNNGCPPESKMEYLGSTIFDFTTDESSIDILFAEKMIEVFTPKFWAEYDARRLALNLDGKVIWPQVPKTFFIKHQHLLPGKELKREIRYVPKGTQFDMGYNICGNTVCFVSSKRENFGFLVESDELAQTLSTQFDLLWETLKPVKNR